MQFNQSHQNSLAESDDMSVSRFEAEKRAASGAGASRWVSSCKHLLCLIFPLTTLSFLLTGIFVHQGPLPVSTLVGFTLPFWAVLYFDWRCPKETTQASSDHSRFFFNGILWALTLIQILNIWLMLEFVTLLRWDSSGNVLIGIANLVAVRFLVGTSSGTSGIVLAHELIHRPKRYWQLAGRLLLCTVCYEHFVITHKRGHHLNLGMPGDIATAQLGESFKDYWHRIVFGYLNYALRSERERLRESRAQVAWLNNQVWQGLTLETAILLAIVIHWGWLPAIMFLYQAWAAVRILEAVNYFQHWGLENGQFGNTFGWVCPSWISRYALIGLSHHIGHHQDENKHYYEVAYSGQGPKLPYGYFVMNLWVKLGNGSYQQMAVEELEKYRRSVG